MQPRMGRSQWLILTLIVQWAALGGASRTVRVLMTPKAVLVA
jgi:hypothetical protein